METTVTKKANDAVITNASKKIKVNEELVCKALLSFFYKNDYLTESEMNLLKQNLEKERPHVGA